MGIRCSTTPVNADKAVDESLDLPFVLAKIVARVGRDRAGLLPVGHRDVLQALLDIIEPVILAAVSVSVVQSRRYLLGRRRHLRRCTDSRKLRLADVDNIAKAGADVSGTRADAGSQPRVSWQRRRYSVAQGEFDVRLAVKACWATFLYACIH